MLKNLVASCVFLMSTSYSSLAGSCPSALIIEEKVIRPHLVAGDTFEMDGMNITWSVVSITPGHEPIYEVELIFPPDAHAGSGCYYRSKNSERVIRIGVRRG